VNLFGIILDELFEFLFVGMIGDFAEEEFVFVGGELFCSGEFIKVGHLEVAFGHADGVEP